MRMKIGNAEKLTSSIRVYLNIGSWSTMLRVREALKQWLPDVPAWKSPNHYIEKSYYRNSFRWDGEYVLNLPLESEKDVSRLVRFLPLKGLTVE